MRERMARRLQVSQRERGFTLVELVVAMFVIATVLLLLISVQISASSTIKDARMREQATALANESLERLRAIPWGILLKGMDSNFADAALVGTDPYYATPIYVAAQKKLTIQGQEFTLRVAPSGASDQISATNTQPWEPLFDSEGSNRKVVLDPGGTGTEFVVRSYVTEPLDGAQDAVGLLVVVTWIDTDGNLRETVVNAPSFAALSCSNDEARSPFVSACEARLTASAYTGPVVANITAWNLDTNAPENVPIIPNTQRYSIEVVTASTRAAVASEQTSLVTGTLKYGRTTMLGDPTVKPIQEDTRTIGFFELAASDFPVGPGAAPDNPPALNVNPTANQEPQNSASGSFLTLSGRSDFRRPGQIISSTKVSCFAGIPAGQPCTFAKLDNRTPDRNYEASSNFFLTFDPPGSSADWTVRLMRRLNENGGNQDQAWAARFTSAAGSSAVGCTTLSGPGCVAAGAKRNMGTFAFASIINGTWSTGNQSIVLLQNYSDEVKVQRGASQKNTAATVTRSGTLTWWNGSSMESVGIDNNSDFTKVIGPAYWDATGGYGLEIVRGTATVRPVNNPTVSNPDPNCITTECTITADSGSVQIALEIRVFTPANPAGYAQRLTYVVNPVTATATYKDVQQ